MSAISQGTAGRTSSSSWVSKQLKTMISGLCEMSTRLMGMSVSMSEVRRGLCERSISVRLPPTQCRVLSSGELETSSAASWLPPHTIRRNSVHAERSRLVRLLFSQIRTVSVEAASDRSSEERPQSEQSTERTGHPSI